MIRVSMVENIDPSMLSGRASRLEQALAIQILKDTVPFIPAMTLSLTNRSRAVGDKIIFPGPYARYLWHGKAMVNAATGKGPMKIPEVGYRWPRGAILAPPSRPLKISTAVHKDATSHWMDVSKARNMKKWEKMGAKLYADDKR